MDSPHFSELHSSGATKVANSDGHDRLSELPDALILEILSLLQLRDAVRTTLLSKRWKNRWTTIPCLNFWYHSFDLLQYRSFINGALAQWEGAKILKFNLPFSSLYPFPRADDLDSWLLFAIDKKMEELSLHLHFDDYSYDDSEYCPPQTLYSCSSIRKLSFSYLKLKVEGNVQWDLLKSLTLVGVDCLSADALNRVLAGAPQLEELIFASRTVSEDFNIRSTGLKTLSIGRQGHFPDPVEVILGSELRIWAPNLLKLVIFGEFYGSCFLDVPSLTVAVLEISQLLHLTESEEFFCIEMFNQIFQRVSHVEDVTLWNECIKFLLYMKMMNWKDLVVEFPNAKFLSLYPNHPAHEILDVLEMFPKLITLTAKHEIDQESPSFASMTSTYSLPHLKTVEITWSALDASIFRVIRILLENALALEKMVLRLSANGRGPERREEKLDFAEAEVLSMPRSSPLAELHYLQLLLSMKMKNMKDLAVHFRTAKYLNLYLDQPAHEILDVLEMFSKFIS